jgi:DNA-binding NarL/FixJ family response regulator
MRPSILIADDHRLFAEGLRSMLSPLYDIVGIAMDGRELTEMAGRFKPDLILTDLSMPLLNGLDAVQNLAESNLRSRFVVLTMHLDVNLAVQAFRAGASGFILKTTSADELIKALQVVHEGGCYLSRQFPCDLVTVLAEAARRPAADRVPKLTRRQREVLQLVAEGKIMKEVAAQLKISTRTAESYKYHLMDVLAVRTNAELVQYAIKIGLINVNPLDGGAKPFSSVA